MQEQELICVGKVSGVFGIKGWIKVFSYTETRENILSYSPWILKKDEQTRTVELVDGNLQGKAVVAQLNGIDDRNGAEKLIGWEIFITPAQLPKPAAGEYYWRDLIGLTVETTEGVSLGVVDGLMETGANDVLIVQGERERIIPFLQGQTVLSIDLEARTMIVDWDADF